MGSNPTVRELLEAVKDVPDWHALGTELDLPRGQLREIELQYQIAGVGRQKSAMFDRWLARCVNASWAKLAAALDRMGEEKAAATVRFKYCGAPPPAPEPVVQPAPAAATATIALDVETLLCLKYMKAEGKEERVFVVDEMASKWRRVGKMLKFSDSELNNIESSSNNVEQSCETMITKWLDGFVQDRDSRPKSWPTLLEAMRDARLGTLADKVAGIVQL